MIRAALAIGLSGLAAVAEAREPLMRVPFVGCPSGGQMGLQRAPKSGKARWIKGKIGAQLAYYSPGDFGVFAPRGWYCAAVYGSSGAGLIVTPEKATAESFRRLSHEPIRSSFVWAGTSFGGTSGRGTVIEAIARYFPTHRDFIQKARDQEPDLDFGPLLRGPYPHDIIRQSSAEYVRFTTSAWRKGEGAGSLLAPNAMAVEGFRKLIGPRDEPDLWGVDVRLPASQADVTRAILAKSR